MTTEQQQQCVTTNDDEVNTLAKVSKLRMETGEAVTTDNMDHTFCGIMFDLIIKEQVPIESVVIQSLAIRGALGRISIYASPGGYHGKELMATSWKRIYGPTNVPSSMHTLRNLELADGGLMMKSGEVIGLYIHSERADDSAIVYDNARSAITFENHMIKILPGMAHLSNVAFSNEFPWAWRSRRAFVGSIRYGVIRLLWRPQVHARFPPVFRSGIRTVLLCHLRHPLRRVPHAVLLKIINYLDHTAFALPSRTPLAKRGKALAAQALSRSMKYLPVPSQLAAPVVSAAAALVQQDGEEEVVPSIDGPTCTLG